MVWFTRLKPNEVAERLLTAAKKPNREVTKIKDGYIITMEVPKLKRFHADELFSIINVYINESIHKSTEAEEFYPTLAFENIANVQIQMSSEHTGKHC